MQVQEGSRALFRRVIASDVGALTLIADNGALVAVLMEQERPGRVRLPACVDVKTHPVLDLAAGQLCEFFDCRRTAFEVPIRMTGTEFQRRVWEGLLRIPAGELWSYGRLAEEIGSPGCARAVGAAVGRNPISIIVPCHRVVGGDGSLTGFAGGLRAKEILIQLERAACEKSSGTNVRTSVPLMQSAGLFE